MSKETAQTIKEMASLVVQSNRISAVHEQNLKMFHLIYFNGISEAKIDYDLNVRDDVEIDDQNNKLILKKPITNPIVSYYLTLDENADNSNLDKRFKALEDSVRQLFWKEVVVEVYFNDRIVYKSKKYVK